MALDAKNLELDNAAMEDIGNAMAICGNIKMILILYLKQ